MQIDLFHINIYSITMLPVLGLLFRDGQRVQSTVPVPFVGQFD
jgi:hypothetical protein